MLRFNGARWMGIAQGLTTLENMRVTDAREPLSEKNKKFLFRVFKTIDKECGALGLKVPVIYLKEWLGEIRSTGLTYDQVIRKSPGLRDRIREEMSASIFFAFEPNKSQYYDTLSLLDSRLKAAFASTLFDFEEAGKCLAMARNTATVFHLMRVMESGLRALGKSLKDEYLDPTKNPNWEAILRKCSEELSKPLKDRPTEWKADDQFFSHAVANLRAVKDAWRNPTMHVGKKYTDEEAVEVFNAVRAFMRHLSMKLSEANINE